MPGAEQTLERSPQGTFLPKDPKSDKKPDLRRVEDDYLLKLSSVCTMRAWAQICAKAVEQAKSGNGTAREWLSRYLLPKDRGLADLLAKSKKSMTQILNDFDLTEAKVMLSQTRTTATVKAPAKKPTVITQEKEPTSEEN